MGEEALDFLNIAFRKVNLEGFEIMATCRKIRKGKYDKESGQEAADLLICAFEEDQVDYDKLDHKAKNAVYEALFFVISHPRCFSGNQRSSVKELVEDGFVTLLTMGASGLMMTMMRTTSYYGGLCADYDNYY